MKSMKESLVESLKKSPEDLCRRLLVEILTENSSGIFEAIPCRITEGITGRITKIIFGAIL